MAQTIPQLIERIKRHQGNVVRLTGAADELRVSLAAAQKVKVSRIPQPEIVLDDLHIVGCWAAPTHVEVTQRIQHEISALLEINDVKAINGFRIEVNDEREDHQAMFMQGKEHVGTLVLVAGEVALRRGVA